MESIARRYRPAMLRQRHVPPPASRQKRSLHLVDKVEQRGPG